MNPILVIEHRAYDYDYSRKEGGGWKGTLYDVQQDGSRGAAVLTATGSHGDRIDAALLRFAEDGCNANVLLDITRERDEHDWWIHECVKCLQQIRFPPIAGRSIAVLCGNDHWVSVRDA